MNDKVNKCCTLSLPYLSYNESTYDHSEIWRQWFLSFWSSMSVRFKVSSYLEHVPIYSLLWFWWWFVHTKIQVLHNSALWIIELGLRALQRKLGIYHGPFVRNGLVRFQKVCFLHIVLSAKESQQTRNHFCNSWHMSYWFMIGTAPPVRVFTCIHVFCLLSRVVLGQNW